MSDETVTYEVDITLHSVPTVQRDLLCPKCDQPTLIRTHYPDASVAGMRRALMFDQCPCLESEATS